MHKTVIIYTLYKSEHPLVVHRQISQTPGDKKLKFSTDILFWL